MFPKVLLLLTAFTVVVSAQSGISQCILSCVGDAVTANGCGTITNTTCICGSAQLQADTQACIQAKCPGDLQSAADLQKAQCAGVTPSGSVSSKPAATGGSATATSPATTASKTSASTTPSSTSSSAGSMLEVSVAGVAGALMACALAL